ncbi:hypothetical protein PV08_08888 [Exophiala spinifera]|uniref:GH16 domain-containing protein n=1 Tax=Exophiala spinifera TaxID=91928 RepID=A0A0D1ZLI8_9EURO|nr:uncharacterized protein PV08_08888 [Exophiala spinifera]KIW13697.1 hypothetical protein PV08_08888 [Exophiala spinifera]
MISHMSTAGVFALVFCDISQAIDLVVPTYSMVRNYTGPSIYQNFDFFSDHDPSNSFATYVDLTDANSSGLAGYQSSKDEPGPVYLGVDHQTITPNGRPSVRLEGQDTFNHSLIVADIHHMPWGCGTWPAFWLLGQGTDWPKAGEIDIIEGINNQSVSIMALHTKKGVFVGNLTSAYAGNTQMAGTFTNLDCNLDSGGTTGCAAKASWKNYGAEYNAQGGGVVVTEITSDAISIWSFPRDRIPQDVLSGRPNPHPLYNGSQWGPPEAKFVPAFNSSFDDHFFNLKPIFNTAFCGPWIDGLWNASECASLAPTCSEYVSNNPAAFSDAYWAIGGIQVYEPIMNTTSGPQAFNSSTSQPNSTYDRKCRGHSEDFKSY